MRCRIIMSRSKGWLSSAILKCSSSHQVWIKQSRDEQINILSLVPHWQWSGSLRYAEHLLCSSGSPLCCLHLQQLQRINHKTLLLKSLPKFESIKSTRFLLSFSFEILQKPALLVKCTESWQNYSCNADSCQVRKWKSSAFCTCALLFSSSICLPLLFSTSLSSISASTSPAVSCTHSVSCNLFALPSLQFTFVLLSYATSLCASHATYA